MFIAGKHLFVTRHVLVGWLVFHLLKHVLMPTKRRRTDVLMDAEVLLEISFGKLRHQFCLWSCGTCHVQPKKYVRASDAAGGFYCFDIRAIKTIGY